MEKVGQVAECQAQEDSRCQVRNEIIENDGLHPISQAPILDGMGRKFQWRNCEADSWRFRGG